VFGTILVCAHNHHFWSFLCFRQFWHESSCMSESKPIVGFYRPIWQPSTTMLSWHAHQSLGSLPRISKA
jgi:hypothetical protein